MDKYKNINMVKRIKSRRKQKILFLLEAGIRLGATHSVGKQLQIASQLAKEWREIDRAYLWRCVREFHRDRLVDYREHDDGDITIVINEKGKRQNLRYNIDNLEIAEPKRWDGKWRVVCFDIPEKLRRIRDAFRFKLQELGFHELQKSVWICPFPCFDELNFIIEFFEARRFIRLALLDHLTNEEELLLHFNLQK